MSEYLVRAPGSENTDGPFSVDQLKELVTAELVTPETLYKTEDMEDFLPIGDQSDLWGQIKAQPKVGLKLKKKESKPDPEAEGAKPTKKKTPEAAPPPSPTDESSNIDVMLAAAEGKTAQTKHVQKLKKSRERAVTLLLPGIVLMLFLSIGGLIQPVWEQVFEMFKSGEYSVDILFNHKTLLFVIADLFLAIGIGLGQTGLFPLLRFRAALGLGFFAYVFYSRGDPLAVAALTGLQFGMLSSTLCTRLGSTFIMVAIGLGGGGVLIWLAWFKGMPL